MLNRYRQLQNAASRNPDDPDLVKEFERFKSVNVESVPVPGKVNLSARNGQTKWVLIHPRKTYKGVRVYKDGVGVQVHLQASMAENGLPTINSIGWVGEVETEDGPVMTDMAFEDIVLPKGEELGFAVLTDSKVMVELSEEDDTLVAQLFV